MKARGCSFKPLVSPYALKRPVDWDGQFGRRAPIDVEIGFGMGEVLMRMARQSPGRNFVGIERHWERMCKTLRALARQQAGGQGALENIRILKVDARAAFERLFAPASIDRIYCLFPCPWPKRGHVKHRLFTNDFFRVLNNRLKKGGEVTIVTDFHPFYEWVLGQVKRAGFQVKTGTVRPRYDTKFERKWRGEGQEKFFEINLVKKRHIEAPLKRDAVLKDYTLNDFDAGRFRLPPAEKGRKDGITVVFKDMLFDQDRQKVMIRALVAEEHLTQHFWIAVTKKQKVWRVAGAGGQNFFPTPGIARAVALVYEAAAGTGNR